MDDLISRQAAIERIEKQKYREPSIGVWKENDRVALACYDTVIEALKRLPSVEPKKGKWAMDENLMCVCSECGYETFLESRYCPNCGADMRESE